MGRVVPAREGLAAGFPVGRSGFLELFQIHGWVELDRVQYTGARLLSVLFVGVHGRKGDPVGRLPLAKLGYVVGGTRSAQRVVGLLQDAPTLGIDKPA